MTPSKISEEMFIWIKINTRTILSVGTLMRENLPNQTRAEDITILIFPINTPLIINLVGINKDLEVVIFIKTRLIMGTIL